LGQNVVVSKKGIIGIFDMDKCTSSHLTRRFLSDSEKKGEIVSVSDELPKVFAVYEERGSRKVYLSQLSAATLMKRWDLNDFEN
jgi:hypothetical protein